MFGLLVCVFRRYEGGDKPRFGGDRDGYRGGPRGGAPGEFGGDKGGAPADYQPRFGVYNLVLL